MANTSRVRVGDVNIDFDACRVYGPRGVHALTPIEVKLMASLSTHRGKTLLREQLLTEVWGYACTVESRAVDHAVARLRRKIERDPKKPRWLTSVRGNGYKLEHEAAEPSAVPAEPASFVGTSRAPDSIAGAPFDPAAGTADPMRRSEYDRAQALFRSVGDHGRLGRLLVERAINLLNEGDGRGARDAAEEGRELLQKLGLRAAAGVATMTLAGVHLEEGTYAAALDLALSAQAIYRRSGSLAHQATASALVGCAELGLRQLERATAEFTDAIEASARSGGSSDRARAGLALTRFSSGDPAGASDAMAGAGVAYAEVLQAVLAGTFLPPAHPDSMPPVEIRLVMRLARELRLVRVQRVD